MRDKVPLRILLYPLTRRAAINSLSALSYKAELPSCGVLGSDRPLRVVLLADRWQCAR